MKLARKIVIVIGGLAGAASFYESCRMTRTRQNVPVQTIHHTSRPASPLKGTPTPRHKTYSAPANVSPHQVFGSAVLRDGTFTVHLRGSAKFSGSSDYVCDVQDRTDPNVTGVFYTSGSQFTIVGTGTDTVSYLCTSKVAP